MFVAACSSDVSTVTVKSPLNALNIFNTHCNLVQFLCICTMRHHGKLRKL
jgi:hypothetical protein